MSELSKFVANNLFETKMSAGGLDGWSNYSGVDWSGWVCGLSTNRDADTLTESNFECALIELGGEVEGQVEVREVGHWACGWFKQIMINVRAHDKVQKLYEIHKALESYPVLDDSDYSEREYKEYSDYAEQECGSLAEGISEVFKIKNSKKLKEISYEILLQCQFNSGGDGVVTVSSRWGIDNANLKELKFVLDDIRYNYKNSRVFKTLVKAVNEYKVEETK